MKKLSGLLLIFCLCIAFVSGCTVNTSGNISELFSSFSNKTESSAETSKESSVETSKESGAETSKESSAETSKESSAESSQENSKEVSKETEDTTLLKLRDNINKNNCMLGVAFIGYVDSASTEKDLSRYLKDSGCAILYPFVAECVPVFYRGSEFYAFVPSDDKCTITIYKSDISEDGEYIDYKDTPLYQGKAGETVAMRCNLSEIYSNVLVSVKNGEKTLEFHPMLSMMDGHLAKQDGCYDFSVYGTDDEPSDPVQSAYDLLMSNYEVKSCCEQGMSMLYTGDSQIIDGNECLIFVLRTENEDQFVREQYYAVSGDIVYYYDEIDDEWIIPRGW
ncbi:MAG: hypothetical protein PUG48_06830 [Clostridia bacterium]|nr:hypothetical protein [Clostridia bacterium]